MGWCRHCKGKTRSANKWCEESECQKAKEEHNVAYKKQYNSNLTSSYKRPGNKSAELNGRKCMVCGANLRGYNFYRCKMHQIGTDDYMMSTGVCL